MSLSLISHPIGKTIIHENCCKGNIVLFDMHRFCYLTASIHLCDREAVKIGKKEILDRRKRGIEKLTRQGGGWRRQKEDHSDPDVMVLGLLLLLFIVVVVYSESKVCVC